MFSYEISMKRLVFLLVWGFCSLVTETVQAEVPDWSGVWETQWRNGGAVVYLKQDGDQVQGRYPLFDGKIEGVAEGRRLKGTWVEAAGREGGFIFALADDGNSFMGRFDSGEWWTGQRTTRRKPGEIPELSFDSPREVFRTFLLSGEAVATGDVSQLEPARNCVIFPDEDPEAASSDMLDQLRLLVQAVNETTFRIWDIPGEDLALRTDTDRIEATLTQAGTQEELRIQFVRVNGGWRILMPPEAELRQTMDRLLEARAERGVVPLEDEKFSSARETMRTFLLTFGSEEGPDEARMLETMDLSHLGSDPRLQEARLLSEYLKRIIDRVGFVMFQEIPNDPWQKLPYVHFQHPAGHIVMEATGVTENGVPVWQFSRETMKSVRELYLAIEDMPVAGFVEPPPVRPWSYFWLRQHFRSLAPWLLWRAGGVEIWQWTALLISVLICWLAAVLASKILVFCSLRAKGLDELVNKKYDTKRFKQPLRVAWTGFFLNAALGVIGLPDRISLTLGRLALSAGIFAVILLVIRVLHVASRLNAQNLESPEHNHRGVLLSLTLGLIRVTAVLAGVLWLADIWSVPYSSMLTGLGIGGIAVALATQSTLQNVIAGFTLFADRPLSVGDFCKYGNNLGSVERIGLRSVRIRTLDRSVVSIPTAAFAEMQLENLAVRDRFLLRATLGLRFETTGDQLRFLLAEIRKMLVSHPKVLPDPARVRFDGFGDYSLNIDIFSYVGAADWNEYLAVREDINFRLMKLVEAAGTGFAFPSQTTYLARDGGLDDEKGSDAERQVDRWRKTNKLPSPDYAEEDLERMEDSLDYPPEGSVLRDESEET